MLGTVFSSLTAAIEQASDCIVITDAGGTIEYVNSAFTAITGYSKEEAVGQKHSLLSSGRHSAAFYEELWRTIRTGQVWHGVVTNRRKDGTLYDEEMRITPVRGPDGNIGSYIAIKYDVTEKRALEESRNLLATIVEASEDAIVSYSPEGVVLTWNRGAESIFGYSAEEVIGKPLAMLVAPERLPFLPQFNERLLQGETISQFETLCVRKDGETIHASVTGCSIRNSAGRVAAISLVVRDTSVRFEDSQKLQESERRFRGVFENASIGICVVTPDARYIHVNAAFCEMVGYSEKELLEKTWPELCHPDDLDFAMETKRQYWTSTEGKVGVEGRFIHRNGNVVWSRMNIALMRDAGGNPLYSVIHAQDVTERKGAEEARRESEERFRNMADSSPSMMWVTGAGGEVEFANRALREFCGSDSLGVPVRDWFSLLHPDDAPLCRSALEVAMSEKTHFRGDWRIRRADGAWRLLGANAQPRLSPDGKYLGHIGLCADITERRLAEQALRNSEEKFRQLAENIREVFFIMSPSGAELLYVSPAAEEVWGVPLESLYKNAMAWADAIHPDDRAQAHGLAMRQLQGERLDSEFRILTPDGKEKWIHSRTSPVLDQAGELTRVVGIAEEITERRQAEISLRRIADRLTLATRAGGVGTWSNDLVNHVLEWDEQMYRLYGVTRERFACAYEAWQSALHPDDRQRVDEEIEATIKGEKEFDSEFRVVWPDGSIHHIRALALLKRDHAGKAINLVGTNWDITAQKHAAEALLESNWQLEKETSRANQLAIEAEKANAAKSEFLANMSHEIRTPMNGIMGLTGLLLETELDETQHSYADTVLECAGSLLTLINDILDISKIEAGKIELEAVEFDLEKMLEDLVSVLAVRAHGKGLELLFEIEPEAPTMLRGDVGRLRQIVNNLVGNAIKFTSAGDVELNVTLSEETEDEVLLHFSVRDSGIGIPADRTGRLFNKFSQVDSSTTRLYGGTGLGLAISKQLAEMMGGAIGVTSKEGEGSKFWFTARFAKQARARVERIPPSGLAGGRALIVKDRDAGFGLLDRQLRSAGLRTSRAENYPQTLQALYGAVAEEDPFHIVVVDLPARGDSLARTIKGDETLGEVRVVILEPIGSSSSTRSPELDKLATYVTRPVRSQELLNALCPPSGKTDSGLQSGAGVHATGATPGSLAQMQGRILLAEDNVTNQKVAVGILRKLGLSVDVTCNGAEALKALEAKSYDLILMDVQMPVMDGIQATKTIRASRSAAFNSKIPIIALTAHARRSDQLDCIAAGMNDYLSKPVMAAALTETIHRWLATDAHDIETAAAEETLPAIEELPALPVFDREGMSSRLMGDEELMKEVISEFLIDTPTQIAALRMLIDQKDATGAGQRAHQIKGSASNVGGEAMRAVAYELEQAGKGGDMDVLASGVEDLDREFLRLRDALTTAGDRPDRSTAREKVHQEDTGG